MGHLSTVLEVYGGALQEKTQRTLIDYRPKNNSTLLKPGYLMRQKSYNPSEMDEFTMI